MNSQPTMVAARRVGSTGRPVRAGIRCVVVMSVSCGWCGTCGREWDGVGADDRDQGQPEVAELVQQPVEGGLVGHRSAEDGGAVVTPGQGEPVQPGGPPVVQAALDT